MSSVVNLIGRVLDDDVAVLWEGLEKRSVGEEKQ